MDEYEKSEYDQKIPQAHTAEQLTAAWGRATRHQEDKQSKTTSSLFPVKMIAKLERTHSNVQQNMEQTQNPTMGATINNNRAAALERHIPSLLFVRKSNIVRTSE